MRLPVEMVRHFGVVCVQAGKTITPNEYMNTALQEQRTCCARWLL